METDSVVSVSQLEKLNAAGDLHAAVAGECSRLNLLMATQSQVQPVKPTPEQTASIRHYLAVSKIPQDLKLSINAEHLCGSKKAFQTLVKGLEEDTSLMKLLDFCTFAPLTHPNPLSEIDMTVFTRN